MEVKSTPQLVLMQDHLKQHGILLDSENILILPMLSLPLPFKKDYAFFVCKFSMLIYEYSWTIFYTNR